jgi:glycosyltransferase involved in cell wall biosynthesis
MKKTHILHLEASTGWGGQEMRILKEMQAMTALGYKVYLGVMRGGVLAKRARACGFEVEELDFRKSRWIQTFMRLVWMIQRCHIGIVHTHSSLDAWIGGLAARFCRVSIVRTRHISAPIRGGVNAWILYGLLADFVVGTCSTILPHIAAKARKSLSKCQCVVTGIDVARLRVDDAPVKAFQKQWALKQDHFVVGTVCVMRSWKGLFDLLEAAYLLRNKREIKWFVIGGGHEQIYRQRARTLGLDGVVSFTGHLEEPLVGIQALDLFVLLSTSNEGVSQASLQAAGLGKPLLTTPTGGLSEICIHGVTGFLVPALSPQDVADRVLWFLDHPEERRKMGLSARDLALKYYTWDQTVSAMDRIYDTMECQLKN